MKTNLPVSESAWAFMTIDVWAYFFFYGLAVLLHVHWLLAEIPFKATIEILEKVTAS